MEVLAHYLPQYHPIPENDRWWGPGYTEWSLVAKARPLFRGHVQPHLPRDLGLYDLRVPEVREEQATLAAAHGLTGFIYWHYWLGGKLLLERPLAEVIAQGRPDFPFCVAWANHSWERRWGFDPRKGFEMLLEQTYPGETDDRAHFEYLRPAFEDPRHVRLDDRPVFFIFEPGDLPDPRGFVERWQEMANDLGGLYLVAMCNRPGYRSAIADGFDAVSFGRLPIDEGALVPRLRKKVSSVTRRPAPERHRCIERFTGTPPAWLEGRVIPVVTPNWDNTPRRGVHGVVVEGATPSTFSAQLPDAIALAREAPAPEQALIIRSWNEWGEGNYLEPDQAFGLGWLKALRDALIIDTDPS